MQETYAEQLRHEHGVDASEWLVWSIPMGVIAVGAIFLTVRALMLHLRGPRRPLPRRAISAPGAE